MLEVAIVAAKRTAVGNFAGTLASVPADELGATVIRQLLLDTSVAPDQISEVILGQVLTGGQGQESRPQGNNQRRAARYMPGVYDQQGLWVRS